MPVLAAGDRGLGFLVLGFRVLEFECVLYFCGFRVLGFWVLGFRVDRIPSLTAPTKDEAFPELGGNPNIRDSSVLRSLLGSPSLGKLSAPSFQLLLN